MPAIIVSRLELTWAHIREATDLVREERSAQVNLASFLGAPRSKPHVRGRLTPTRFPARGFGMGGPLLPILARYILTAQALGEDGAVG